MTGQNGRQAVATVIQPQREIPVIADVDVCVIGGGPGGLPAAIAAARQGASTLLIEMQGFLGGMATSGQVGPILAITGSRSTNPTVAGLLVELCDRLAAIGQGKPYEDCLKARCAPFGVEGFKVIADRLVAEAGVRPLLHAFFVDSLVEDGCMTHAIVESKSGRQAIKAKVFVDGTGDADVAFRAGAKCTKGRSADGLPMAMGSEFILGGTEALTQEIRQALIDKTRAAAEAGEVNVYGIGLGGHGATMDPGHASINCTRFGGDCSDVDDLTQGEITTRETTWKLLDLWRGVPGAEGLHLVATPAHVGIRESRQLVGLHRITGQDVIDGRKHENSIARCSYWIDIHCPRGLGVPAGVHLCSRKCTKADCYMLTDYAEQLPDELYPPDGDWFDIPYRTLVPETVDGLLVSGRCISADYQAMGAMRVIGPCMAIGEAAGIAAAMAAKARLQPRDVDVEVLRKTLTDVGALV
jgi:hypothetical protein